MKFDKNVLVVNVLEKRVTIENVKKMVKFASLIYQVTGVKIGSIERLKKPCETMKLDVRMGEEIYSP